MKPRYRQAALAGALGALALWALPASTLLAPAVAQTGFAYQVEIEGVDGDLRDLVLASSRLISGRGTPPFGLTGLRQRSNSDIEVFGVVLRSQGYYGASIELAIDAGVSPAQVDVAIAPGPQFRIADCRIAFAGAALEFVPGDCSALGLARGAPALASTILAAEGQLRRAILEHAYPAPSIERNAFADHGDATMSLEFTITPGGQAELGPAIIAGNAASRAEYLQDLRTWEPGALYDVRLIDSYRQRLNDLDLFDSVVIAPLDPNVGLQPVNVTVHERPTRSLGFGLRYATTEGVGVNAYWEHRNLYGAAERLRFDLGLAELAQSLRVGYSLPHRPNPEQRLDFGVGALHETTDAYTKTGGEASTALTTPLGALWRGKIGAGLQVAETDDGTERRFNILASLPADISYDGTDSLFDPTLGERYMMRATAVGGSSDGALGFVKLEAGASAYRRLNTAASTILAGRLNLGTVLGASSDTLPPDWRFYSGGGGSVRGFGYQQIGPLDATGDPRGGSSLAEVAVELRQRLTEKFGGVAFVEAGSVGRGLSGFDEPLVGAGVGLRYYTVIGPIRADIATPLNPRPGDAQLLFYISIGQAF